MKVIKWFTLLTSLLASLSFSGCGKPEMLDGPGMEYTPPWTVLTLTGSDFCFTVEETGYVTGSCREGECSGMELALEDLRKLQWLDLEDAEESPDSDVALTVTLPDGQVVSKNASMTLSLEIYEILLPYFKNLK